MKATILAVPVAISLLFCCTPIKAQTPSPKLTVNASLVNFGDHDIGTVTIGTNTPPAADNPLAIRNGGDAAVSLSLKLSGSNPEDFSTRSTCSGKVPAKGECAITVVFSPTMRKVDGIVSPGPIDRSAILEVKGDSDTLQIQLTGRAFQNLSASPAVADLVIQRWSSVAAPRLVSLTNYTDTQLESVTVTVTGNFTEDHAGCVKVDPGNSCAIYVTYPPRQTTDARGSLAFTGTLAASPPATNTGTAAPPFRRLTRGVVLNGTITSGWQYGRFDASTWFLLGLAGIYFLSLVAVRWHMIAKPARAEIVAEIRSISARVNAESASLPESREKQAQLREINRLLDVALYPFRHPHFFKLAASAPDEGKNEKPGKTTLPHPGWWTRVFNALSPKQTAPESNEGNHRQSQEAIPPYPWWRTRVLNALFWTRGSEYAGWRLAHEAERRLVELLPLQSVRARLEIAEQELRALNTPVTLALADRVHQSLASGEGEVLERERALLKQLQSHLKPLSVPEAARRAWLADLQSRAANSLQGLGEWISKNTDAAANVLEGKAKLEGFLKVVKGLQELATEVTELEKILDDSVASKKLLQRISGFLAALAVNAQPIEQASTSSTLDVDTCNSLLASLKQLGTSATDLYGKLKLPLPEQAKAFQDLLNLCKARVTLIAGITQATTQGVGVGLLQEILAAMQQENELVQKISQCKDASEVAGHREDVRKLAVSTSLSATLMDRITSAIAERVPEPLGRWRALLAEALALIDSDLDDKFSQVTGWHNKLMWLVVCALLFLVSLGLVFENGVLLLVGAVGGLLSRLQRTIEKADVPNDYGATWGALFLSPLTGALTAWGGALLIMLGLKLNVLGAALNLDWNNPYDPTALAIALAFGFSERWFSGILDTVESKVAPPAGSSSTSTTVPAPKITSTDPKKATLGKENKLTVLGTNFQNGATATVTDSANNPISARVDYQGATTILVTFTPQGNTGYTTTLTVTNPDKQPATYDLQVTAP
jgi:hypothetical protein